MSYKKIFGAVKSPIDIRDYRIRVSVAQAANLEDEFELSFLPTVKNQGDKSTCVPHAIAACGEYFDHIQNGIDERMSTNWIYGDRDNSLYRGEGMVIRDALDNAVNHGLCFYVYFPGNDDVSSAMSQFKEKENGLYPVALPHAFSKYFKIKNDTELKIALKEYGPVVFSIPWYTDMKYSNGVVDSETRAEVSGYHCMIIYGWNEIGFKVQNSWGKGYGKKGRFVLPYRFKRVETYGVIDRNIEGIDNIIEPNKKLSKPIIKFINKILNFLIKLIK